MKRRTAILIGALCSMLALPAWAGPRDFVISMSGFLGTTGQAAPVLSKLFRQMEGSLGWPEDSIDGAYYPDADEGLAAIKRLQPGFAVVSHQMLFEHRRDLKMQVIGAMELSDDALSRFHVVTKKQGGPSSLSELAGKRLASPFLEERRFVEKVLLGGKIGLGSGAGQLHPIDVRSPLSALRKVSRGQAEAALVDEPVVEQMSKLPFGEELRVIHSSDKLPPMPVVALQWANKADVPLMAKALIGLCNGSEGGELCRSLRLESVQPANERTFAGIQKQLSR